MSRTDDNDENGESESTSSAASPRKSNPVDVHVGSRVRVRRMILGLSQEKLGEKLGLTFQQVQKYERGTNRVGASRLFDLARVLDVPIQFFFDEMPSDLASAAATGFSERPAENPLSEYLSTRDGLELNRAFARITDPKVRKSIVDLVRSLAGETGDIPEDPPAEK